MNILGIGLPELILIFIVAMIVLGPRNMIATSSKLGDYIRKLVSSDSWKSVIKSTKEIRDLQGKIMEDSGLPETLKTLQDSTRNLVSPSITKWNSPLINTISPAQDSDQKELEKNQPNNPIEIDTHPYDQSSSV